MQNVERESVSEQKPKMFLAIILALLSVSMLAGASYQFFPSQEGTNVSPLPSAPVTPSTMPIPFPTTSNVLPVPSPVESPSTNNTVSPPFPSLLIELSPFPGVDGSLYVAQGESITINLTLTSYSDQTEFTIPLYLAIGAFQNQPLGSGYKIIALPPAPYSSQLPWPAGHIDNSSDPKPFTATFDSNPTALKPNESRTTALTIRAAENATLGAYSMVVELGNWQQTNVGGTTFQLTVTPKP
jgi:hypothetical protein